VIHSVGNGSQDTFFNALRCFEASARRQSFLAAADELRLTPSAVSHQIRELEEGCGVEFFVRSGRRMLLTPAGTRYYARISKVLQELSQATSDLKRGETDVTTLNVSVAPHFASYWLMPRLAAFLEGHPRLELTLLTNQYPVDLSMTTADCEIRLGHGKWLNIEVQHLTNVRLVPLCSPRFAEGKTFSEARHVADHKLIYTTTRPITWDDWARIHNVSPLDHVPKLLVDRSTLAIDAALAGLGIALESEFLAAEHLKAERLVAPLGALYAADESYFFLYQKTSPKIAAILELSAWLKGTMASIQTPVTAPASKRKKPVPA
jgi:LysR family glycine cleavage system transcriptional activator